MVKLDRQLYRAWNDLPANSLFIVLGENDVKPEISQLNRQRCQYFRKLRQGEKRSSIAVTDRFGYGHKKKLKSMVEEAKKAVALFTVKMEIWWSLNDVSWFYYVKGVLIVFKCIIAWTTKKWPTSASTKCIPSSMHIYNHECAWDHLHAFRELHWVLHVSFPFMKIFHFFQKNISSIALFVLNKEASFILTWWELAFQFIQILISKTSILFTSTFLATALSEGYRLQPISSRPQLDQKMPGHIPSHKRTGRKKTFI